MSCSLVSQKAQTSKQQIIIVPFTQGNKSSELISELSPDFDVNLASKIMLNVRDIKCGFSLILVASDGVGFEGTAP